MVRRSKPNDTTEGVKPQLLNGAEGLTGVDYGLAYPIEKD